MKTMDDEYGDETDHEVCEEYLEGTIPYEEFKINKLDEQIESFTIFENSETNEEAKS